MATTTPVLYGTRLFGTTTYALTTDGETTEINLSDTVTLSDATNYALLFYDATSMTASVPVVASINFSEAIVLNDWVSAELIQTDVWTTPSTPAETWDSSSESSTDWIEPQS